MHLPTLESHFLEMWLLDLSDHPNRFFSWTKLFSSLRSGSKINVKTTWGPLWSQMEEELQSVFDASLMKWRISGGLREKWQRDSSEHLTVCIRVKSLLVIHRQRDVKTISLWWGSDLWNILGFRLKSERDKSQYGKTYGCFRDSIALSTVYCTCQCLYFLFKGWHFVTLIWEYKTYVFLLLS